MTNVAESMNSTPEDVKSFPDSAIEKAEKAVQRLSNGAKGVSVHDKNTIRLLQNYGFTECIETLQRGIFESANPICLPNLHRDFVMRKIRDCPRELSAVTVVNHTEEMSVTRWCPNIFSDAIEVPDWLEAPHPSKGNRAR